MALKKRLRGYMFSRKVDGQLVPQRLQNMLIREYVESRECEFLLSAVEYYMDDCYMMLDALLERIDEIDGLVFFSMTFLPSSNARREALLSTILNNKKEIHFALENLAIKNAEDVERLNDIIATQALARTAQYTIDQVDLGFHNSDGR